MMNQNQIPVRDSGNGECPGCHGRGYVIKHEEVEGYESGLDYAEECTACRGKKLLKDGTGIPLEFSEADLNRFDFTSYSCKMENFEKVINAFFEKFEKWEAAGKGLYLWSKTPGSGKTYLSCSVANSLVLRYGIRMRFVTAPGYLAVVGSSIKRQQGTQDESEIFRNCSLLVLDDIGAQKNGDWQEQEIFRLIDSRTAAGKITLFTSNMQPEDLNLNSRTVDRIRRCSIVLQMPEESIRRRKAEAEQERFLHEVLGE